MGEHGIVKSIFDSFWKDETKVDVSMYESLFEIERVKNHD